MRFKCQRGAEEEKKLIMLFDTPCVLFAMLLLKWRGCVGGITSFFVNY